MQIDTSGFVDIPGYEGLYSINRNGDIYCYPKFREHNGWVSERIMRKYVKPNGYVNACLRKDGVKKYAMVHRIVAKMFVENPNGYRCIDHKNSNKQDNDINNLQWCTHSYNNKQAYARGEKIITNRLRNVGVSMRKVSFQDAEKIRELYKAGGISQSKLAREYGMQQTNIGDIINHKTYKVVSY